MEIILKIYKRSVYEDQKYRISFGTKEDLKDWKEEEKAWIEQDFSVADDTIEEIGETTDENIGEILQKINNYIIYGVDYIGATK